MKWEINGLSLEFDIEDLETAERYENAFAIMGEEEKQIAELGGKISDRIRAYCNLYLHLFENLFGKETAGQIFANQRMNARIYEEIYLSFLRFVQDSALNTADRRKENLSTLGTNRAQKRAMKKKAAKK